MYEFAIVVLLGIGSFKLVDMLNEYVDLSKVHTLLTIMVGVAVAWAIDFSLFAHWGIDVRSDVMGYIGTGLMIAAAGYATPQVFEHIAEIIGHRRDTKSARSRLKQGGCTKGPRQPLGAFLISPYLSSEDSSGNVTFGRSKGCLSALLRGPSSTMK